MPDEPVRAASRDLASLLDVAGGPEPDELRRAPRRSCPRAPMPAIGRASQNAITAQTNPERNAQARDQSPGTSRARVRHAVIPPSDRAVWRSPAATSSTEIDPRHQCIIVAPAAALVVAVAGVVARDRRCPRRATGRCGWDWSGRTAPTDRRADRGGDVRRPGVARHHEPGVRARARRDRGCVVSGATRAAPFEAATIAVARASLAGSPEHDRREAMLLAQPGAQCGQSASAASACSATRRRG